MKVINGSFRHPVFKRLLKLSSRFSSTQSDQQKPAYPEILDNSDEANKLRKKHRIAAQIKKLHTVEEKLFAINLPRYYGWNSLILEEGKYPYNFIPFVQHVTRTRKVIGNKDLLYKVMSKDSNRTKELLEKIRPMVQEALLFELKGRRWQQGSEVSDSKLQNKVASNIITQINNIIISTLSSERPYIFDSVVDYEPRIESFWSVGGFYPGEAEILARIENNKDITEDEKHALVQHWIQYLGSPALQVRISSPLGVMDTEQLDKQLVASTASGSDNAGSSNHIPKPFPYDPTDSLGLEFKRRNGTNIPGFWPGEEREFGLVSYHVCGHMLDRPPHFGKEEANDTLTAQAILASFAWLHAQATYQGFSCFDEVTYPLVNQCIVTDGHRFSTHIYQLNTIRLDLEDIVTNPRCNICMSLPHLPLYADIQNNEFVGWNDEVLETLLLPYLNEPVEMKADQLKPNLHPTEKYLACIDDEQKARRAWLHKQFMHMYSNRPRSRLPYEIYDWERIYKIKFPMRPLEARLRPFELDCNPLEDRKYYEHMHEYIPRAFRPRKKHWTGWRARFDKTYYPEIEF